MRVGLLHAARWFETGKVVGIDSATPRSVIEAKLGAPTDFGADDPTLVKYDELEVFYGASSPEATPRYLMHDFWGQSVARWRDELRFIQGASRPLSEALCECDLARIADVLRTRGVRVLASFTEYDRRVLVDAGNGVTIGLNSSGIPAQPVFSGAIFSSTRDEFDHAWRRVESPEPRRNQRKRR